MSFLLADCKELDFGELLAVNGGCAGGGSCSGGYGGGGGGNQQQSQPSGPKGPTGSQNNTSSGNGGCSGSISSTLVLSTNSGCSGSGNPNVPKNPNNTNLPAKEMWIGDGDHCDIFAWNIAIDNGVDPRNGKNTIPNLNNITVNQFFDEYCKNDSKSLTEKGCAGQMGFIFFDWGGDNPANQDGKYDHMEFCKFSEDGSTYVCYKNNGQGTPIPTVYVTSQDSNGQGGKGTKAVFVPLN